MPLIRPYRGVWSGRLLPWVSENEPSRQSRKLLGLCSISHTALEYRQGPRFMRGLERCSTCGTDESRSTDQEKKMRKLMMLAALLAMVALAAIPAIAQVTQEGEQE